MCIRIPAEMEEHAIVCNAKRRELDVYTKKRVFERLLELRRPTKEQIRGINKKNSLKRFEVSDNSVETLDKPERTDKKAAKEVGISINTQECFCHTCGNT